jgi:uncharacterized membrane protein
MRAPARPRSVGLMHDPLAVRALLWTHVAAGAAALLIAPMAMRLRKGALAHRLWGRFYFWAMAIVAATAMGVVGYRLATVEHPAGRAAAVFFGLLSVLSFYAAFTGYRSLFRKRPERGEHATWLDWTASAIALVAGAGFVAWSTASLVAPQGGTPPGDREVVLGWGLAPAEDTPRGPASPG